MDIGIRSSSCTRHKGCFGLDELRFVRSIGFDLVEINFNHPSRAPKYEDAEIWRNEAATLDMRLLAHAPTNYSISSLDMDEVESGIREYRLFLDKLPAFGIVKVVAHACVRAYGSCLMEKDKRAANTVYALKQIAAKCQEHRIHFMLETTVPGRLSSRIDNLIEVVDAADSPWIGICVDTNHSNLSENIQNAIRNAAGRLGELHLNDNHGLKEEHLLPFDGVIDWKGLTRALHDTAFNGDMIMEPSWKQDDDSTEMVRRAFRVAKKLSAMIQ